MKPNGSFKINLNPKLLISHRDKKMIEHIVDIAPKEAQWFHRVERIETPHGLYYRLYELYFPEQYCSAAEVESNPQMMYEFYKELKKEHGQEATNDIMSNLTAWAHSHHNMGVSPSGQDIKQFAENIENADKAKVTVPQIMLIFNKKGSYHCKVWDPKLGVILENLPMVLESYDFSNIDKQAKLKFKKRKTLPRKKGKRNTLYSKNESWDFLGWGIDAENEIQSSSNTPSSLLEQYASIGLASFPSIGYLMKHYQKKTKVFFLETIINEFALSEVQLFHAALDLNTSVILELETAKDYSIEGNFEDILDDIEMHDHDDHTMMAILTFIKFLEKEPDNASTLITEFDSVIEDEEQNMFINDYNY